MVQLSNGLNANIEGASLLWELFCGVREGEDWREEHSTVTTLILHSAQSECTFFTFTQSFCFPVTIILGGNIGIKHIQEHITRSLQLRHIPVAAFSQTDLFLVWIYLESRSPQEPQWPIAITSTDWCRHVHVRPQCFTLPKRALVDWNWPISL